MYVCVEEPIQESMLALTSVVYVCVCMHNREVIWVCMYVCMHLCMKEYLLWHDAI